MAIKLEIHATDPEVIALVQRYWALDEESKPVENVEGGTRQVPRQQEQPSATLEASEWSTDDNVPLKTVSFTLLSCSAFQSKNTARSLGRRSHRASPLLCSTWRPQW